MNYNAVEIIDYTHDGLGIGKADGFSLFIPGTALGDVVDVSVTKDMKTYAYAKVLSVHKTSTVRPACGHYEACGACQIMHLSSEAQATFKARKVTTAMQRIAKLAEVDVLLTSTLEPLHYRHKVRFHVVQGKLGYFQEKSHQLVEITDCLVISKRMMKVANSISFLDQLRAVTIRTNQDESELMVILEGSVDHEQAKQWARDSHITSLYVLDQELLHLSGSTTYQERYQSLVFDVGPKSFFQIAPKMAFRMFETALSWLDFSNKHVVDLYSGVGVIGLLIAGHAKQVTMIESNPHAVAEARLNSTHNQKSNIEILQGSVHQHLSKVSDIDVIIVDPPRSGLDKKTISMLMDLQVKELLYISCEPSTLARDLLELKEQYVIQNIQSFDMFAQTSHVETAVYLKRKQRS